MKEIKKLPLERQVYMTESAVKALREVEKKRTIEEIAESSEDLYEALGCYMKHITANAVYGQNLIIKILERHIGATTALIRIANDYDVILVIHPEEEKRIKYLLKTEDIKINVVTLPYISKKLRGCPHSQRVIIKSEGLALEDVRRKIGSDINVIGIEQIDAVYRRNGQV